MPHAPPAPPGLSADAKSVLVQLYWATGGATWGGSEHWLTGDPCGDNWTPSSSNDGTWAGVICASCTGAAPGPCIQSLTLASPSSSYASITKKSQLPRLTGTLPPALFSPALHSLDSLSVRTQPYLSGTLPHTLNLSSSDFPALTSLVIDRTRLSGTLPGGVFGATPGAMTMTAESAFSFQYTYQTALSGTLPEFGAVALQTLLLTGNELSGTIPTSIGRVRGASYIGLHASAGGRLSGTLPTELARAFAPLDGGAAAGGYGVGSTQLLIQGSRLSGTLPTQIGLAPIGWLRLAGNELSGTVSPLLFNSSWDASLSMLSVYQNRISGSLPPKSHSSLRCKLSRSRGIT